MKKGMLKPIADTLVKASRTFCEMDVFSMRVLAGAAALAALMLAAACGLALYTYMTELPAVSRTVYGCAQLACGLFEGGMRLMTLGCASAVIADIALRSQRSLL